MPGMAETEKSKKIRIQKIIKTLRKSYPEAKCALFYSTPFELLAATILSAQCTDKRVNMVTPALFRKYPDIPAFAAARQEDLEQIIQSTGFYRNKAKNIIGAAQQIIERYRGEVPKELEALIELPGIGRKTANVILGNAYGIPGIPVDTHMIRINNRLKLTSHQDPVKIEFDLMPLVPQKDWTEYSHLIILHGRSRCFARKPDCSGCEIEKFCPSANLV